jgi:hypothetical protein
MHSIPHITTTYDIPAYKFRTLLVLLLLQLLCRIRACTPAMLNRQVLLRLLLLMLLMLLPCLCTATSRTSVAAARDADVVAAAAAVAACMCFKPACECYEDGVFADDC